MAIPTGTSVDAVDSVAVGAVAIHPETESDSCTRIPDPVGTDWLYSTSSSFMVAAAAKANCAFSSRCTVAMAETAVALRQDMDLALAADQDLEMVAVVSVDRADLPAHAGFSTDAVAAAVVATDCALVSRNSISTSSSRQWIPKAH